MSTNHQLPTDHPTLQVFVDESGTGNDSDVFVLGALSLFGSDTLLTELAEFRRKADWTQEIKFSNINRNNAYLHRELAKRIAGSGAQFRGLISDRSDDATNVFAHHHPSWRAQGQMAIRVVRWAVPQQALCSVMMDRITTPGNVNFDNWVCAGVNRNAKRLVATTVTSLDSRSCLGLQVVDFVCGAIAHQYRQAKKEASRVGNKAKVAASLAEALNVDSLVDIKTRRIEVARWERGRSKAKT